MADGHDLHLDAELAEKLQRAAEAAGMTLDAYAKDILTQFADADWAEDDAAFAEYERTGVSYDAREALAEFAAAVAADHPQRKA